MCTMQLQHVVVCVLHLLSAISCHLSATVSINNVYESPCPATFNYFLQDGVLQYGLIRAQLSDTTTNQLRVELSVGNNVQGYNGELVLANSRAETIESILERKPILYRLNFPNWYNYPPKVTKITLNGQMLCQGPPIDIKTVRVLTTINLQHTLRLNLSPGVSFTSSEGNKGGQGQAQGGQSSTSVVDFSPNLPETLFSFFDGTQRVPPIIVHTRSTTTQRPLQTSPPRDNVPPVQPQISSPEDIDVRGDTSPQNADSSSGQFPRPVDRGGFNKYGINADECGISFNTNTLIANGMNVKKGQYPWLVAIFLVKSLGPEFLCGGNLISHKHVITAGHCMKISGKVLAVDKIFMRIGEHNIHQWIQVTGSRTVGASRIHVHQDYKVMSADGDIALIVLDSEVEFSKFIRPICLWTDDINLDAIVGQLGTVVGWGKDENENLITAEPKQIKFPVVSQEDCLRSHFTYREITSERTFCAGYRNGSGPCNGDSGGGFILQKRNRWTLRGIVSMSIAKDRTCDFSQYFVFADITKYLDWISSNL